MKSFTILINEVTGDLSMKLIEFLLNYLSKIACNKLCNLNSQKTEISSNKKQKYKQYKSKSSKNEKQKEN